MSKTHGLTGKPSNAKKDKPKQGVVQIRIDMDKKSSWVRHAQSKGISLSKFLEMAADSFLEKQTTTSKNEYPF